MHEGFGSQRSEVLPCWSLGRQGCCWLAPPKVAGPVAEMENLCMQVGDSGGGGGSPEPPHFCPLGSSPASPPGLSVAQKLQRPGQPPSGKWRWGDGSGVQGEAGPQGRGQNRTGGFKGCLRHSWFHFSSALSPQRQK